jgi:hypothetical protein
MTVTTGTSVFNPFSTLQSVAESMSKVTQNQQMAMIAQGLQNQLNRQLAAIQPPTDQVSINLSQNRINALQKQQKTISSLETQFGNNGSILSDMANQLNLMVQAIGNGDSTAFDNALSALNTNYTILTPPAWNPIFQNDGTGQFKMAGGINIQSSATYDLSTQAGQDAATADITNVQNLIQGMIKVNGANQNVAESQLTALNGQINSLQSLQFQQQTASQQAVQKQTAQLTQNMQNQLHLIQLSLGQSTSLATAVSAALNPPQPINSVFGALSNSIGQTAAGAVKQLGQMPAVMSLFV